MASLFPRGVPLRKRIFDLVLTIPGIILISPILGITAILVKIRMGSPVLFRQVRPGFQGETIVLNKFRTMIDAVDEDGKFLSDDLRLTKLGRFLRSSSLDELPELINVLRGEMSLVGPRPLLCRYLELYTPEQSRRHDVLPGISGWAQVNGRNAISWEQKFKYDVWYVDHWSFKLDLKILWMTFSRVFRREGINLPGFDTTEEFRGTPRSETQRDETET
jgi:sugar transferase EpsL